MIQPEEVGGLPWIYVQHHVCQSKPQAQGELPLVDQKAHQNQSTSLKRMLQKDAAGATTSVQIGWEVGLQGPCHLLPLAKLGPSGDRPVAAEVGGGGKVLEGDLGAARSERTCERSTPVSVRVVKAKHMGDDTEKPHISLNFNS